MKECTFKPKISNLIQDENEKKRIKIGSRNEKTNNAKDQIAALQYSLKQVHEPNYKDKKISKILVNIFTIKKNTQLIGN